MRYDPIPSDLFVRNRKKLTELLKDNALVIVQSSDEMPRNGDQNFSFRQNSDMFYLTGLDQEKCVLLLYPGHPMENMREVVLTVKTNDHMVTWYGHKYTLEQASEISGVKNIKWLDELDGVLHEMLTRCSSVYLNMEEYPKFISDVPSRSARFAQTLKQKYPLHRFERLAPLVNELRLVKEPEELELIKKACQITSDGFNRVLKFLKPGVMEYEVEAEITHEFVRQGSTSHAYPPIIASGVNNNILHYGVNDKECKDGDLLLMDFGAEYANYASDLSRTIPVNGKFSPRQRQVYEAVLRILRNSSAMMVPGTTIDDFHAEVLKMMEKELIGLGLITKEDIDNKGDSPAYYKYYMHGTSHFIGLDVHDVGSKQHVFRKGMVLSCEPAIYLVDEGFGIRLENDILVDDVPVDLMADIPIDPDEIERLMSR